MRAGVHPEIRPEPGRLSPLRLEFSNGKTSLLRARSAVFQYLSAAFIQAKPKVEFIGGNRLCQVLSRCKPTRNQDTLLRTQRGELTGKLRSLRENAVICFLVWSFGNARHRRPDRPVAIERFLVNVVEERSQCIEVLL